MMYIVPQSLVEKIFPFYLSSDDTYGAISNLYKTQFEISIGTQGFPNLSCSVAKYASVYIVE